MSKVLGGGKKKSKSTTTVNLAPPTEQETALIDQQLQLATQQLTSLRELGDFTSERFQEFLPILSEQVNKFSGEQDRVAARNFEFAGESAGAQSGLLQSELGAIRQGPGATPDQTALISAATDSAIQAGLSDISAFRDESLEQIGSELAPGRGLRTDDTPILDVAGRVARDSTRQAEKLITSLRGQQAQAQLEFPLQAGQFQAQRTQAQQQLGQGTAQFSEQLRQQAFNNRLNLTALTGQQGLGISALQAPNPSTLAGLQDLRLGAAGSTTKTKSSGGGFASTLGAVGGLAVGLGSLGFKPFTSNP